MCVVVMSLVCSHGHGLGFKGEFLWQVGGHADGPSVSLFVELAIAFLPNEPAIGSATGEVTYVVWRPC
jgi:hypothetical protein